LQFQQKEGMRNSFELTEIGDIAFIIQRFAR
jgi:hypothetical protein